MSFLADIITTLLRFERLKPRTPIVLTNDHPVPDIKMPTAKQPLKATLALTALILTGCGWPALAADWGYDDQPDVCLLYTSLYSSSYMRL